MIVYIITIVMMWEVMGDSADLKGSSASIVTTQGLMLVACMT